MGAEKKTRQLGYKQLKAKRIIGVISGKGGVGKSLVTSMLAVAMRQRGFEVGILDADLTGPTIPTMFGIPSGLETRREGMGGAVLIPAKTRTGIHVISVNCMLDDQTDPVLWGGDALSATLKRFWVGVSWEGIDYLFIDMPPGTGDIAMTVFESLPVDTSIIVASPQKLVGVMVEKCIKMVEIYKVPISGIVQNMSYFECAHCGEKTYIFGTHGVDEMAEKYGIEQVTYLPFAPAFSEESDAGNIEQADTGPLDGLVEHLLETFPVEKR